MANYKDIVGTAIRTNAGDLSGVVTGEIWFDSTNLDFKYKYPAVTSAGAWRTGGNINEAKGISEGAAGTQTAALIFGGGDPNPTPPLNTESYDGSTWTELNNMNTAKMYPGGDGTQTSAIAASGAVGPPNGNTATVETGDGS